MSGLDEEHFFRLVQERSGLTLSPAKSYLIESRLKPIADDERLADVPALLARLRTAGSEPLVRRCVDAMATHETFFFRDATPFDQLRSLMPELIAARARVRTLRIWSAACSSGQEPYSLAMLLQEFQTALCGWRIEIVATDMNEAILRKAQAGRYNAFEASRGLSQAHRDRWMVRSGDFWQVSETLAAMVSFRRHNLIDSAAGLGGSFDVVFCRNVLIYFDRPLKKHVLNRLAAVTAPDGVLFLGSAETVLGLSDQFRTAGGGHGVFRRADASLARPEMQAAHPAG